MALPEIDPVEIALAVIGVRPIISKAVERVGGVAFSKMDRFPRRLAELAAAVCRDELHEIPLGSINYNVMLRDISEPYEPRQVQEMVSRFPADHSELASAFQLKAAAVMTILRGLYPMATAVSLANASVRNLLPPQAQVRRFVATLEVLDDPLRAFALIGTGAILLSQVSALRQVYPTVTKAIDAALRGAIDDAKAARQSFELPSRAERGVLTWFDQPIVSPRLFAALQGAFKAQQQQQQNGPPKPSGAATSDMAKDSLTAAQRASYPDALK